MLGGAVLGVLFGLLLPNVALWFEFAGTLFLNALTLLAFPLIFLSVIVGLVNLGDYRKLGRISGKTFGLFGITSGAAVLIGIGLALIIGPGRGVAGLFPPPLSNSLMPHSLTSIGGFLESLLPANLIEATAGGQYLGLVVISIILGAVLSTLSTKVRGVVTIVRGLQDILHRLVALLMIAAPVGMFFLTASVFAAHGDSLSDSALGVAKLSLVVVLGLAIQLIVILPLILGGFARRNPGTYYRNLWPAMLTGFTTGSSVAAYPITYENVIEGNSVDARAGSLVLPLSLTLHNCGSALFLAAAAIFIAQAFAIPVTVWLVLKIFVAALIVSLGVSGIPSGALFGLAAVGSFVGFPREALVVFTTLLAIDWLLDRVRTVVNVAGDGVAAAVIAETFEFKTVGRKALRTDSGRDRQPRPGFRGREDSGDKLSGRGTRPVDTRRGAGRAAKPIDRKDDRYKRSGERSPETARPVRSDSRADQPDRRQAIPAPLVKEPRAEERPKPERSEEKVRSDRPRDRRGRDTDRNRRRDQRPPRSDQADSRDSAVTAAPVPAAESASPKAPSVPESSGTPPFSPDKIERELSAVRAQLRHLPDRPRETEPEKQDRPDRREESAAQSDTTTARPEPQVGPETQSRPEPQAKPEPDQRPTPAAEPVHPTEQPGRRPAPEEKADTAPASGDSDSDERTSFGRGKHRKTPLKTASEEKPSSETTEKKPPEQSYETESISFGRGKRKKGK
jgi:Na+/H+-dicarboxylate symporter